MQKLKRLSLLCLFVLCAVSFSLAQQVNIQTDRELLRQHDFSIPGYQQKTAAFMLTANDNVIVRYNPVSLAFGSAMYVYQNVFSRQFSANCLYSPSCSEFSKRLISEFGLIKGVFLSTDRISRCNRISAIDIHPAEFGHDHKLHEEPLIYRLP